MHNIFDFIFVLFDIFLYKALQSRIIRISFKIILIGVFQQFVLGRDIVGLAYLRKSQKVLFRILSLVLLVDYSENFIQGNDIVEIIYCLEIFIQQIYSFL